MRPERLSEGAGDTRAEGPGQLAYRCCAAHARHRPCEAEEAVLEELRLCGCAVLELVQFR